MSRNSVYIPSLLSLPPLPTSHASRSSQSGRLSSLCYIALSVICQCYFLNLLILVLKILVSFFPSFHPVDKPFPSLLLIFFFPLLKLKKILKQFENAGVCQTVNVKAVRGFSCLAVWPGWEP